MDRLAGPLWAISPVDGRYASKLQALKPYVSEGALINSRITVELKWLSHLGQIARESELTLPWKPSHDDLEKINRMSAEDFSAQAHQVKEIEAETNHDVKAVEYFLRAALKKSGVSESSLAMIHFACTSEDINNLAYNLLFQKVNQEQILPQMRKLIQMLSEFAKEYAEAAMLSRTHGQPASPTTMGKELANFAYRLNNSYACIKNQQFPGKVNGAVGNYNAHIVAFPQVNWEALAKDFVEDVLGLNWNPMSTQIENHDGIAEWCGRISQWDTICLDLARDIWGYISLGYFKQKLVAGEVGSSTMPHKVNPIDFENAEGNFGITISLADHFARKLPISRWQRDLSDSTVLRATGSMLGHHYLAQSSLLKGLKKLSLDQKSLFDDLSASVEVLAEPIQTVMRAYGVLDAYERLKEKTRGQKVDLEKLHGLINDCSELPSEVKDSLKALTPEQYTGLAAKLTRDQVKLILADING
ncbi:MAG: adenylosuccinate lyase [Oligoflexales bacterium]